MTFCIKCLNLLQMILTPQYIELKKLEALSKNNKVYYGNSIPNIFLDNGNIAAVATSEKKQTDSKQ